MNQDTDMDGPAASRWPTPTTDGASASAGTTTGTSGPRTRASRADLYTQSLLPRAALEPLAPDAALLPGFAAAEATMLCAQLQELLTVSPWRHMLTPGGQRMSVGMTNCGRVGWISDRAGYRYQSVDPQTGRPWPAMPAAWCKLATRAAASAGFKRFEPDACLINRYAPGARLSLHQDRNERDLAAPVVSVSLGLPALFLFGGAKREDPTQRVVLFHGDVAVWGGAQRLAFHGVQSLMDGEHADTGRCRINLTFRRAL
jgi:alkylated DNA repair protein (DNA oxidative demethylase)